jgi:hypothetical protein
MPDLFSQLRPMSWRGIQFPTANFRVSLQQDHVEHKFADTDGAHIEATGREPMVFSARLMFRNGIVRGPNEGWPAALYPVMWKQFMAAAADRSSGIFQHPELGPITCKLRSAETVWDANIRDGVDVDATWVESTDDTAGVAAALTSESPVKDIKLAAASLDASTSITRDATPVEKAGVDEVTFTDLVNSIQTVTDQAALLNRQTVGKIDAIRYRTELLIDSVERAGDVTQWPIKQAAERMRAGLTELQKKTISRSKPVSKFVVPRECTMTSLALTLGRHVTSLISLNPRLVAKPTIRKDTVVRYFTDQKDDIAV